MNRSTSPAAGGHRGGESDRTPDRHDSQRSVDDSGASGDRDTGPASAPTASNTGPWVVCEHLRRYYGSGATRVVAVDDVSATVAPGARVAVTGPSGSGKSTLLHLMAGLDTPTAGEVRWPRFGATPRGRPDAVGMVFQGPSLLPDLDVAENVGLPLLFAASLDSPTETEGADRVANALARVGIAELGDKLPEELSGGQAQRVAVARVLVARPQLILADEPTGQLDQDTGAHVVSVLLDAADDLGAALVVATHDPSVADRLTERWAMRDGRLTGATTPTSASTPAADSRAGDPTEPTRDDPTQHDPTEGTRAASHPARPDTA